jgi:hypothetical protein
MDPEWHEAVVDANIEVFKMYFKRLENLENIWLTNSQNPSSLPVKKEYTICYQ